MRFGLFPVIPLLVVGSAVSAQSEAVLHEYFIYDSPTQPVDNSVPRLPEPGATGSPLGPDPSTPDGESLTLTPGGPVPSPGFFEDGMGGLRNGPSTPDGDVTLDRDTGPEGHLRYQAVFEPSVSPWKRSAARDVIVFDGAEIALRSNRGSSTRISVAGSPPRGFDSFVGRVRVQAMGGEPIPIPSVAPDMRFHAVRTSPPSPIEVYRDSSDNYSLLLGETGEFDIEFDVSAPRRYFGGELPDNGATPGPSTLPDALREPASRVLEAVGVTRGMSEVEIAERLSAYFGSFEARHLHPSELSEDAYADIALGRVGVCRHRAIAFVITAAATGLRARYVMNEAHAFVEVYFTNFGYRRIDLGGASEGLETLGGTGQIHQPPHNRLDAAADSEDRSPYARTSSSDGAAEGTNRVDDRAPVTTDQPEAASEPDPLPDQGLRDEPQSASRERTILSARLSAERAYRGDEIAITATLEGLDSGPVAGAEIVVELVDQGSGYRAELGILLTSEDGRAADRLRIPDNVPSGRLALQLRYPGDAHFAPAEVR